MSACEFEKEIDAIIVQGDPKTLVRVAEQVAAKMVEVGKNGEVDKNRSVSTSQIRNIYGTCKTVQMKLRADNIQEMFGRLLLLKPKMAYAEGRVNKNTLKKAPQVPGFKTLVECLSHAIDLADGREERMKRFFDFFEAILAYHKAEGGK